jgi:xanthine/uracil permease
MALATPTQATETTQVFDVRVNENLPFGQLAILAFQFVFGMTGMFVFPGLLGRSMNLPPEQIAYLYGMAFIVCGVITIFQSVLLLRLPITQGPYSGNFAALLAIGHLKGLGTAYGSFFVASLIWCLLTVPIRGFSVIGMFARYLRAPIISGMIVMLTIIQITNVALPNWIGTPASPGFPIVNLVTGAIAVAVLIGVTVWGGPVFRRGAILAGLAVGTLCYALVRPISLRSVTAAPWLVTPRWFPFGFGVETDLVVIFLLVFIAASIGSIAMYQMVADWGGENLPSDRASQGIFAVALGSVCASIAGGFSTIVYPDNVGMLRTTRVGSRYSTLAAGILLIVLGGVVKFDMMLVLVPQPVLSGAATLLFGLVFMHGAQILAAEKWDERKLAAAGLAIMVGLGGLFVGPETTNAMPLAVKLLLQQPVISGGLTLVILHAVLCQSEAPVPEKKIAA